MKRLLAALLCSAFCAVSAVAQTAPEEKLKAVEDAIALTAERKAEIEKQITEALAEEEQISAKLIESANQIEAQQAALNTSKAKLEELKKEEIVVVAGLAAKREVLSEILAGLQLLERNPPPALVVNPGDVLGALRGAMMFGAVVPELQSEAAKLADQLQRLNDLRAELKATTETATNQIAALGKSSAEMQDLRVQKRALLDQSKVALKIEDSELQTLSGKAKSLRDLLDALQTAVALEQNRRDAMTRAETEEAKRVAELKARPLMRLSDAKGLLQYPVQGDIVRRFGEDNGLGSTMLGLALSAEPETLVKSPVDGRVEYAGRFRSLTELLILDAGENYRIVIGGFDQIDVKVGEIARAGEPLGRLGRKSSVTTFMDTGIGGDKPLLYVEFRKSGEPIDSTSWWIGSQKEAQK